MSCVLLKSPAIQGEITLLQHSDTGVGQKAEMGILMTQLRWRANRTCPQRGLAQDKTKQNPADTSWETGDWLTLPEGQENDRLDHEEFEDGAVGTEQLTCSEVKEEEGIQCQADWYIVNYGHIEIPACDAARRKNMNISSLPYLVSSFSGGKPLPI